MKTFQLKARRWVVMAEAGLFPDRGQPSLPERGHGVCIEGDILRNPDPSGQKLTAAQAAEDHGAPLPCCPLKTPPLGAVHAHC